MAKLRSVTTLVLGALVLAALPACTLNLGGPDPWDDPPDGDPCAPRDARDPPYWPDATLEWDAGGFPDADPQWPDAAVAGVTADSPDARPWIDARPCHSGVPDAQVFIDDARGVPDAAVYPDAQPAPP